MQFFCISTKFDNIKNNKDIKVSGIDNIKVELAQCCSPIPGDEIIGYITRGKGVKVHCKHCNTLKQLEKRLIDVEWDDNVANNIMHQVSLIIRASDRNNLLVETMNVLSTLKLTVLELNAISHKENLNASISVSIMVKDGNHLKGIINTLKNIRGVFEVSRVENM